MSLFNNQYIKTGCILHACLVFSAFLLCSCKGNNKDKYLHAYENNLGIKPSKLAQIDTANFTSIQWIERTKNFGTVKDGDSVIIVFRCRNTGDNPLFLCDIKSPCGCTISRYKEKVILPGEEDSLPVFFNTIDQEPDVHKSIVVTSNTSNGAKHTLFFEGTIIRPNKPVDK